MLRDSRDAYGFVTIVLHWLAAVILAYLWLNGPDDHGGTAEADSASHIALGSGLAVFLVARVLWRFANVNPRPLGQGALLNRVASIVKGLLLLDILVIIGTGFVSAWAAGKSISLFYAVPLPALVGASVSLHQSVHIVHSISANLALPVLVGLHVLGALKHLVIDGDGTFERMLGMRRAA